MSETTTSRNAMPLRVRVPKFIPSDMPEAFPDACLEAGEYEATANNHGAVSAVTSRGLFGLKPGEFEWIVAPSAEQMVKWLWGPKS